MALTSVARASFDEYVLRSFIRFLQTELGSDYTVTSWGVPIGEKGFMDQQFAAGKKALLAIAMPFGYQKKARNVYKTVYNPDAEVGDADYQKKQIATGETLFSDFYVNIACPANENGSSGTRSVLQTIGKLKEIFANHSTCAVRDFEHDVDTSLRITWDAGSSRYPVEYTIRNNVPSEYQEGLALVQFYCDYYVLTNEDIVLTRTVVSDPR